MTKLCPRCGQEKTLDAFARRLTGLQSWCRLCNSAANSAIYSADPDRIRARNRAYSRQNKDRLYRRRVLSKYKLTQSSFNELMQKANGRCGICQTNAKGKLCIDHCHQSGKVRGLLCHPCNVGLGMFRDSQELLCDAVIYLGRGKQ